MKHIHKKIIPYAIATFSEEPSKELLDAVTRMARIAYKHSIELSFNNENIRESDKEVCPKCGNTEWFDKKYGKIQCRECGKWWRQTSQERT